MALIYTGGLGSGSFTSGYTDSGWGPTSFLYGGHIVIPSSGTVTQLGVYGRKGGGGSFNIKFGLYTSGGVLVAQSTGSCSSTTPAWLDSGSVSGSVSAGTYYVMVSGSDADARWGWSNTGNGSFATENYASAMAATETITAGGDAGLLYGVRLDFTAGGGGFQAAWARGSNQILGAMQ